MYLQPPAHVATSALEWADTRAKPCSSRPDGGASKRRAISCLILSISIGIVVGKEAALVIDCGLGPVCGQGVVKAAERVAPRIDLEMLLPHASQKTHFERNETQGI
jgi:hypothetical protein